MKHPPSSYSGFTTIEFLLVVVLIALLGYIFVPRFSHDAILEKQVYTTAHDLAGDLRYARRLAMGSGLEGSTSVTIDSGEVFWLIVFKTGTATDSWKIVDSGNNQIKSVQAVPGVQITDNATASFYFDRQGVPYPSGGDYIIVEDYNSKYRWAVSLIRGTGQVKLREM